MSCGRAPWSVCPKLQVLAFRGASADLVTWAEAEAIDISSQGSGCTCSVALRQGSEVQVAWLGDSRAMVATVSETAKVDLVTTPHNTEDVKEMQRVRNAGAKLIQVPPNSGHVRIFTPGERTPGLFATRALGDTSGQALGISWQPHICKMSFARTPGLVMLGSGGLWEILDDRAGPGSEALQLLLGPCRLQECGACLAASQFSEEVQSKWSQAKHRFASRVTARRPWQPKHKAQLARRPWQPKHKAQLARHGYPWERLLGRTFHLEALARRVYPWHPGQFHPWLRLGAHQNVPKLHYVAPVDQSWICFG
ncbi:unnamed protein product [Effrenium voratum]|nr:unnamed protein product [Effrenium voratum]